MRNDTEQQTYFDGQRPGETVEAFSKRRHEPKATRIPLECQECGKRFTVASTNLDPECPKCGGVDWEVQR